MNKKIINPFLDRPGMRVVNQYISKKEIPLDGLIAYYPFNGNANDESGSGYNGTVYNATLTTDRKSQADKAYYFDRSAASNYIDVSGLQVNLRTVDTYSISFWFYADAVGGSDIYKILEAYSTSGRMGIQLNGGEVKCGYFNGVYFAVSESVVASNWYHVVFIKDGSSVSGYLDTVAMTGTSAPNTTNLTGCIIGADTRRTSNIWFDGKIDDIAIYNRVLTTDEIAILYNQ